jgi:hypothetical protein
VLRVLAIGSGAKFPLLGLQEKLRAMRRAETQNEFCHVAALLPLPAMVRRGSRSCKKLR